jgi:PAS domain S-box-containing protein
MLFRINSDRLQREAERQYSEQLQLYIESLEEASDSILIADSEGVLIYANNTIVEGLNKSPSEVIGKSLWEVLFEEESDVASAQQKLVDEGRFHGEVLLADPSGDAKTHEVTIAAVQQSSSNKQAYVGISRDITERKVTEAELEDYRKNLEHLVEERTAALQNEIAENKAIQVHLADSLQEKELLIKEVHHRVKNNMQVISSLLSIQAEGAGDEVYSTLLNESQQRIKSMALIHETLYQSKDLLNIDFQEYIESLTNSLSRSYVVPGVSVHVDVNVENVLLDLETAVPCGLVINELVSNALKHAFQEKEGTGIIGIDFVTNDCSYDLRISDNGVGLPPDFDLKKHTSMGLEIVTILTAQLEGSLSAHNEDGAVFQIQFPRSAHV